MMSTYFLIDPDSDTPIHIAFPEFADLAKGASIISLSESDGFLEFGLSEALKLRFQPRGRLHVTIHSANDGAGVVPLRLQLLEDGEEPSAALVEARLRRLRQTYAIVFLIEAGRENELSTLLLESPDTDLEELLSPENRLYIQSAAPGSLWITFFTKTAPAQRVLRSLPLLAFKEGREHLLRRVRAKTSIQELEVAEKETSVAIKNIEAVKKKLDAYLDLLNRIEKIKDPRSKDEAKRLFDEALDHTTKPMLKLPSPTKK
jgi:hypothetical protein